MFWLKAWFSKGLKCWWYRRSGSESMHFWSVQALAHAHRQARGKSHKPHGGSHISWRPMLVCIYMYICIYSYWSICLLVIFIHICDVYIYLLISILVMYLFLHSCIYVFIHIHLFLPSFIPSSSEYIFIHIYVYIYIVIYIYIACYGNMEPEPSIPPDCCSSLGTNEDRRRAGCSLGLVAWSVPRRRALYHCAGLGFIWGSEFRV